MKNYSAGNHWHRTKFIINLLLFSTFQLVVTDTHSQAFNFRHYTIDDGLPGTTVYNVCQDHLGFIWIATNAGVARFDGKHFQVFTKHDGLSDNEVLRIFEDSKHRLWFLTYNGNPCIWDGEKFLNAKNDSSLSKIKDVSTLTSFLEDQEHNIWLGGRNALIKIEKGEDAVTKYSFPNRIFCHLFQTSAGQIWLARRDSFFVITKGKLIPCEMKFQPVDTRTIYPISNNSFYFNAKQGIVKMTDTTQQLVFAQNDTTSHNNHAFSTGFYDRENNFWVMTMGDKNMFYRNRSQDSIQFLNGVNLSVPLIDRQGNLWLPTLNDALYMLPAGFENVICLNKQTGLATDKISAVSLNEGDVWIGFEGGLVNRLSEKMKIRQIDLKSTLIGRWEIDAFFFTGNDVLCSDISSIAWFNKKDPHHLSQRIPYRNLGYPPSIKKFIAGEDGSIYGFSDREVLTINKINGHYVMDSVDGKLNSSAALFVDKTGRFILAGKNGIETRTANHSSFFPFPDSLKDISVTDIDRLNDSALILSTLEEGLLVLQNFRVVQVINSARVLYNNHCLKTIVVNDTIWTATQNGIDCIVSKNNGFSLVKHFSTDDGLLSNETLDFDVSRNKLYAASSAGLSILPIVLTDQKQIAPPVYLISFIQNKTNYLDRIDSSAKTLKGSFENLQNDFSISFAAPYFNEINAVTYKYRIDKKDEWKITKLDRIELSGLAPGQYYFEVCAKIPQSDWSNPAVISFEIAAPFWQRTWFTIILTLLVAAAGFLFYRRRVQLIYRKRSEQLSVQNKIIHLEQQAMKAMMNPHFIYNVMNSIQQFINTNEKEAANNYLSNFARLIRSNMEISARSYISLEDEMELLKNYLALEQLRFGSNLKFKVEADETLDPDETVIPSMIVQPIVENAIWHGLMPFSGDGFISVYFKMQDAQSYTVEISDNGIGMQQSKPSALGKNSTHKSRGVSFIQQRLDLLTRSTGRLHTISIQPLHPEDTERPGTKVIITVPSAVH